VVLFWGHDLVTSGIWVCCGAGEGKRLLKGLLGLMLGLVAATTEAPRRAGRARDRQTIFKTR
jgi:hypothetical protein